MCAALIGCYPASIRTVSIDQVLHRKDRRHGTFGPTGRRLFTERLDQGSGIRGQFSYIHYADIRDPIRLTLLEGGEPMPTRIEEVDWYPSHLVVRSTIAPLSVTERKFVSDDDTLVDLVTLTNRFAEPIERRLRLASGFAATVSKPRTDNTGVNYYLAGSDGFYGVRAHAVIAACGFAPDKNESALIRTIKLAPAQSVRIPVVMSMSEDLDTALRTAGAWATRRDALEHHCETYQAWFDDNCPQFECDDPYITKMYWYRWFVARHCLSRACTGSLPEPYFFEGTHHSHFSRLIAFSSPHIISEVRWLREPRYAFGQVRNHCRNADDKDGFFISARINASGGEYNNWIVASAWAAFRVHPDRAWLEEVVGHLAEDVLGTFRRYDQDGDRLPAPKNHWTTGMEFQPAFFYFTDYDDTKPDAPLERGDFVAYTHGNAKALAEAYRFLGNEDEARRFEGLAREIRRSCLSKMWDDDDRFLYAIRESDGAVARCREIVGFYPFISRLLPDEPRYTTMLAYLVDPEEFWTPFPPATVSRKCPAYTPKVAHWPAAGGRIHGCMWNGPAWPHATSFMLDVAAAAIQDYHQPHVRPEHFWHMFQKYTHLQYEENDLSRPLVTEYYNGETGAPDPKGCPDYFHSSYCDLVIKYLVGLQPANSNRLTISPIPGPVERFSLRRLRYRGHDLDIVYNSDGAYRAGDAAPADEPRGLTVWIDGRHAGQRSSLGPLTVELPGGSETTDEP